MINICILCLITLNLFCFGYQLNKIKSNNNDFRLINKKYMKGRSVSTKEVLSTHDTTVKRNTLDFRKNQYNEENDDISELINYTYNEIDNQNRAIHSTCQHIHLHFNGTSSEEHTVWRLSCFTLLVLIIIVVLLLNCCHYYYGLGVYYVRNDESELIQSRYNDETDHLLNFDVN